MTETPDDYDADLDRMERERKEHNTEVRSRVWCESCGTAVGEEHHDHKFAAASGYLAGPFCSRDCYYAFFLDEYDAPAMREYKRVAGDA